MNKYSDQGFGSDHESDDECPQFWAADSYSVHTKRQFGLLRGRPLKDAFDILHQESERRRSRKSSVDSGLEISPASEEETDSKQSNHANHATVIPQFVDTPQKQYNWHWALGKAKIINTEDKFEVRLPIGPFQADEISAIVVGNGLTIRCDATNRDENSQGLPGKNRFVSRNYILPLNVDTRTAEFSIVNKTTFKLTMMKDRPLKLAVATFGVDEGVVV